MVRESSRRWIVVSAIAAVLALVAASPASHARTPAQTEVCGELTGATVWNAAGSPYSVTCSVQVPADASLTVEPGVEVRFGPELELQVSGTLTVNGSSPSDVVFTSNAGTPAKGDWRGISVEEGAMADLRGLTVRWAGNRNPAIEAQGNLTLADALIENMANPGVEIDEANAAISNTTIRNGTVDAIVHGTNDEGNTLELTGVTITDNAGAAVTADGNVEVILAGNEVSGNAINGVVIDGSVEREMTWHGGDMPLVIQRPVSINASLTIQPDTWIKSAEGRGLNVDDGGRIESGAAGQPPVFFTSLGDDRCADDTGRIDCDTNNDGDTAQTPGSWATVRIRSEGIASTFTNTQFWFGSDGTLSAEDTPSLTVVDGHIALSAGDAIDVDEVPLTVTGTAFEENRGHGVVADGRTVYTVTLTSNTFKDNGGAVANVNADTLLVTSGNEAVDFSNGTNGYVISGDVTAPKTWMSGDLPFVVSGVLDLANAAAELTMEPGLIVKMEENAAIRVSAGRLTIGSDDGEQVLITALSDDACSPSQLSGCDTDNADVGAAEGYWRSLEIQEASRGAFIRNTALRYGGGGSSGGIVDLAHAASEITGNTISESQKSGVMVRRVSTVIQGNEIRDNNGAGISLEGLAAGPVMTLSGNAFIDNRLAAIDMDANVQLELDGTNTVRGNGINGVSVHDDVLDDRTWRRTSEIPYVVTDRINVLNNKKLTLEPGTVVKFEADREFVMERGALVADGTPQDPIIFTSINDDSIFGDTDTRSPAPASPGDWAGLTFPDSGSAGSSLTNVEIRYSGGDRNPSVLVERSGLVIRDSKILYGGSHAIVLEDVPRRGETLEITDNEISEHAGHGILMSAGSGATNPTIQNNVIEDTTHPLRMEANVQPTLGGNTVSDNEVNGIVVHGSMSVRRTWESVELPWVLEGGVRLQTGSLLGIAGGAVIKAIDSAGLTIDNGGRLDAPAAPTDKRITFTTYRDDSVCAEGLDECDTDGLGDAFTPRAGNWVGIVATSRGVRPILDNVAVLYAGSEGQAVRLDSEGSIIRNSEIAESGGSGIRVDDARDVVIENNIIRDNTTFGIELEGDASGTVTGNILTGNARSILHEADGAMQTSDNVAIGNDADAMLYCADISSDRVWGNDLAREISCSVTVSAGSLIIEPGTLLQFADGQQLDVERGALLAEGVIFSGDRPGAEGGAWRGITFETNSSGYIRHSTLFASGSSSGAVEVASGDVNILYNTFLRMADSILYINERTRDTLIEGNLLGPISIGSRGSSIRVDGDNAVPTIRHNLITGGEIGVEVRDGLPTINYNSLTHMLDVAVEKSPDQPCVNARFNWWGHPTGPTNPVDDEDGCLPPKNDGGKGEAVGEGVTYENWLTEEPPAPPQLDLPMCGVTNQSEQDVVGSTSPNATVVVFDGDEAIATLQADGGGRFSGTVELDDGSHGLSVEARGSNENLRSPRTGFRVVTVDTDLPVNPTGIRFEYGPPGTPRLQPIRDESGCATGCGGPSSGRVTLPPDEPVVVRVPVEGGVSDMTFVQASMTVPMQREGDWFVSSPFVPAQEAFSLQVDGQSPTECRGFIYQGGGGFVFVDSGAPGEPHFTEGFESGDLTGTGWRTDRWTVTSEDAYQSTFSAHDSPDGPYTDEENALYMPTQDLRDVPSPILTFNHKLDFAPGDRGEVQVRTGGRGGWRTIARFDGGADWQAAQVNLVEYRRESQVELRFLVDPNNRGPNGQGWWLDNVTIRPGGRFNGQYEEGEPLVSGAEVTLMQREPATGEMRMWDAGPTGQSNPQRTDEQGRYGFYNLPPGEYRIRVETPQHGPAQGDVVAVWDGTLEYQLPVAGAAPIFLPITANRARID